MNAPVRALVGVGANLGDAVSTVRAALQALDALPDTRRLASSSLYRSAPLDASGPDFINAAAELHTVLPALDLLHRLQAIEHAFGRVRSVRNAPRMLDLDLLTYGDLFLQSDELTLPHPRAHLRAFVLQPLAEIDPMLSLAARGPIGPWVERAAGQTIQRIAAA